MVLTSDWDDAGSDPGDGSRKAVTGATISSSMINWILNAIAEVDLPDHESRISTIESAYVAKDGSVEMTGALVGDNDGLELGSTTNAPVMPTLTTTQRNALTPSAGMIIYNSTTTAFEGYIAAWAGIGVTDHSSLSNLNWAAAGHSIDGNIVMVDNSITGIDTLTFTDVNGTIAGIENQNLVDKTATEAISGDWTWGTTSKILFRDAALFINSSADGQLDIDADVSVEFSTPLIEPAADNTTDLGTSSFRYKEIFGVTVTAGDVKFDNDWRITEAEHHDLGEGLIFIDPKDGAFYRPVLEKVGE